MLSLPNTHQRLFLEKRDFLVANSVFGYLSLAFPIQKERRTEQPDEAPEGAKPDEDFGT
jgi:hypothetical protein